MSRSTTCWTRRGWARWVSARPCASRRTPWAACSWRGCQRCAAACVGAWRGGGADGAPSVCSALGWQRGEHTSTPCVNQPLGPAVRPPAAGGGGQRRRGAGAAAPRLAPAPARRDRPQLLLLALALHLHGARGTCPENRGRCSLRAAWPAHATRSVGQALLRPARLPLASAPLTVRPPRSCRSRCTSRAWRARAAGRAGRAGRARRRAARSAWAASRLWTWRGRSARSAQATLACASSEAGSAADERGMAGPCWPGLLACVAPCAPHCVDHLAAHPCLARQGERGHQQQPDDAGAVPGGAALEPAAPRRRQPAGGAVPREQGHAPVQVRGVVAAGAARLGLPHRRRSKPSRAGFRRHRARAERWPAPHPPPRPPLPPGTRCMAGARCCSASTCRPPRATTTRRRTCSRWGAPGPGRAAHTPTTSTSLPCPTAQPTPPVLPPHLTTAHPVPPTPFTPPRAPPPQYAALATQIGTIQQAEAPRRTIRAVSPAIKKVKRKAALPPEARRAGQGAK